MLTAKPVQLGQNRCGRHLHTIDGDSIASLKANLNIFRSVWRILWADCALIDIIRRLNGRVFQDFAF